MIGLMISTLNPYKYENIISIPGEVICYKSQLQISKLMATSMNPSKENKTDWKKKDEMKNKNPII